MALLAAFLFAIICCAVLAQPAKAVTQSEIDALKSQAGEISKKQKDVQTQIDSLQYQQSSALAKKSVLDQQISLTQDQIDNTNQLILTYDQMISDKKVEVVQAQTNEDEKLKIYKQCVRDMEENGPISYLAVIFDASSYADLLGRVDMVNDIMTYYNTVYKDFCAAKDATIAAEQSLEETQNLQKQQLSDLEVTKTQLNDQVTEASAMIAQLSDSLDSYQDLFQQEQSEADQIQKDINAKSAQLKAQKAAEAAAAAAAAAAKRGKSSTGSVTGTGTLMWPSNASHTVTSVFGQRTSPITKKAEFHQGIDIGAGYGTNILAADSGTVIISTYSSSYGNYVVIDHGNGMTTLYAHMSQRKVSEGANVTKGQVIGLVGSTGNSTGPHIHFEVSLHGSRQNPLNYFSGYTIR